jgi:hypothetical protein
MKKLRISPELEQSLIGAVILGTIKPDAVTVELSKNGQAVLDGVEYLVKRGVTSFTPQDVLVAAGDVVKADKTTLAPYLDKAMKVGGKATSEILDALAQQVALADVINEAGRQLQEKEYDPGAFTKMLDVSKKNTLTPASALLVDGQLPPIPTGVPVSMPMIQAASGGVFGLWALGGKSGVGKSTLGVQIAIEVIERGLPVLYYDMENGESVLLYRIGKALNDDLARIQKATDKLYIRRNIRTLSADLAAVKPPCLIVIDSLQKLPTKVDQRRTGLDHWLHKLEALKEQGYSILMISELNGLGGFKETGEIEYTADFGFQLWPSREGVLVKVLKNRHRPQSGDLCTLERVNDWWFKESSYDMTLTPNQAEAFEL